MFLGISKNLQKSNNFVLFLCVSFVLLSWSLEYTYLIQEQSYVLFILSLFGVYIILRTSLNLKLNENYDHSFFLGIFIGLILLSVAMVHTSVPARAISEYYDQYPESGVHVSEQQSLSRGRWLNEYSQGNFLSNSRWVRADIWVQSGVQCGVHYYDVAINPLLIAELEPEFEPSLLWTSGQRAFEDNLDSRYNPYKTESIIFTADHYLTKSYKINLFVIDLDHTCQGTECRIGVTEEFVDTCMCFESQGMIQFLQEERYPLFNEGRVIMYHYSVYNPT